MYRLRPATQDDLPLLFALHTRAMFAYVSAVWGWDDEFQATRFEEYFRTNRLQVIMVDESDVGFLHVEASSRRVEIANIEIDPAYQGRGIGTAILRDLVATALENGADVELQVLKVNEQAKRLYERLGFTTFDTTETHHRMRHQPRIEGDDSLAEPGRGF